MFSRAKLKILFCSVSVSVSTLCIRNVKHGISLGGLFINTGFLMCRYVVLGLHPYYHILNQML